MENQKFEKAMKDAGFEISETHIRKIVAIGPEEFVLWKAAIHENKQGEIQLVCYDATSYEGIRPYAADVIIRDEPDPDRYSLVISQDETIEQVIMDKEPQISGLMISGLDIDIERIRKVFPDPLSAEQLVEDELRKRAKLARLIVLIAQEEHTNDWDPTWYMELTDGTQWQTASGYWQFIVEDGHLLIEAPDDIYDGDEGYYRFWEPDHGCYRVPIGIIRSMTIDPQ